MCCVKKVSILWVVLLGGFLVACDSGSTEQDAGQDSGIEDAATEDAGTEDAGTEDAGTEDAGTEDAGTEDAGTEDAGTEDAGTEDAGTEDAGTAGPCSEDPIAMTHVLPGTFMMGSPDGLTVVRDIDEPLHQVELTQGFCVGTYEVTQGEFQTHMGYNPSTAVNCGTNCPVESINWHQAAAFANAVSASESLTPCYECSGAGDEVTCVALDNPYTCQGYRMLTEAEWEYMARAGVTSGFTNGGNLIQDTEFGCGGNLALDNGALIDDVCWYCGNAWCGNANCAQPVGGLEPNAWDIYDVTGNVWEWCHDVYADYHGDITDPYQTNGDSPNYRGGSYWDAPKHSRLANRGGNGYTYKFEDLGLRLARSQD